MPTEAGTRSWASPSRCGTKEPLEARFEPLRIGPIFRPSWEGDGRAVEPLQPVEQHGSVYLAEQAVGYVHDASRVDAEQVAVEREVVDRAEREPVDDGGDAFGLEVGNDMCGLQERSLTQRADGASLAVSTHDVELEALLVGRTRASLVAYARTSGPETRPPGCMS